MKIGIVCPYSLDRPGGVQLHVMDLARTLMDRGHEVRVLAPSAPHTPVPPWVDSCGRSTPVPFNGSTARLTFGPVSAVRVRAWQRNHKFDVVHLHEPGAPSLSLIGMWTRIGPTVATFHTSHERSLAARLGRPFVKPGLEVLDARIAVSAAAASTLVATTGLLATHVVPNGVSTGPYEKAVPREGWLGTPDEPTIGVLGRLGEPRKGLDHFLAAIPFVREKIPKARFLVAGRFGPEVARRCVRAGAEVVGEISELEKHRFMASVNVYVAPNTWGESFGIVLLEALAGGARVVASDLPAFKDVVTGDDGTVYAHLHRAGDPASLAAAVVAEASPTNGRAERKRRRAHAREFDWHELAPRVEEVYRSAIRLESQQTQEG